MSVSENIRRCRKGAGLTQKALAAKCGLAEITIRQYENGKREPRSRQIARIAQALNISPADLLLEFSDAERARADARKRLSAYESFLKTDAPVIDTDLLVMGEILVEIMRDREDSPLYQTGIFKGPYPSGAPAICIGAASRMGCQCTLVGSIGDDDFGRLILKRLETDGTDCRYIQINDRLSTGCAFVTYSADGSRRFIFHMGASLHACPPAPSRLGQIKHMHIMGCSLMAGEQLAAGITDTMHTLFSKGTKISFDPNIRRELYHDPDVKEMFEDVLKHTNIFLPGKEELLLITEEDDIDTAVRKCFENPALDILVLKDGSRGSRLYTRADTPDEITMKKIGAYKVEQKDATGAGDCFDGAFLAGLIQGRTPEDAARMGSAAGALNAMAFGPMEGKIDPETIGQMLQEKC